MEMTRSSIPKQRLEPEWTKASTVVLEWPRMVANVGDGRVAGVTGLGFSSITLSSESFSVKSWSCLGLLGDPGDEDIPAGMVVVPSNPVGYETCSG